MTVVRLATFVPSVRDNDNALMVDVLKESRSHTYVYGFAIGARYQRHRGIKT